MSFFLIIPTLFAGCANRHRCCAPPEFTQSSSLISLSPGDASDLPLDSELLRTLAERYPDRQRSGQPGPVRPSRALALSGGGMYGAYTTGVLAVGRRSGTRPTFDVVTGVSTGALVATFAFLGPQYDGPMTELYTTITDRDIYRRRRPSAVLWSDSAADSTPLKN